MIWPYTDHSYLAPMTITSQPYSVPAPSLVYREENEKACPHGHNGMPAAARRCRCENARSRRIITALLLAAFSLAFFLFISCLWDVAFNEASWLSSLGLAEDGSGSAWTAMSGFIKRQAIDNGNGQDTFVHRKCTCDRDVNQPYLASPTYQITSSSYLSACSLCSWPLYVSVLSVAEVGFGRSSLSRWTLLTFGMNRCFREPAMLPMLCLRVVWWFGYVVQICASFPTLKLPPTQLVSSALVAVCVPKVSITLEAGSSRSLGRLRLLNLDYSRTLHRLFVIPALRCTGHFLNAIAIPWTRLSYCCSDTCLLCSNRC